MTDEHRPFEVEVLETLPGEKRRVERDARSDARAGTGYKEEGLEVDEREKDLLETG